MFLTRRGLLILALVPFTAFLNVAVLRSALSQENIPNLPSETPANAAREGNKKGPPVLPEGNDPQELDRYLTRVIRFQARDGGSDYLERLVAAGEEILKRDVHDEDLLGKAAGMQIRALKVMASFGDETASGKLEALRETLSKDRRPSVRTVGEASLFESRLAGFPESTLAEQNAFVNELAAKLAAVPLPREYVEMTRDVQELYEHLDQPQEAKAALLLFASRLEERKDDPPKTASLIRQFVPKLRGAANRFGPIEIQGTTIDGQPFDIANWKGKVVLVDFWATWCGPCRQEIPNVVRHYKDYHDKGFEVVGISLDESADDLKKFLSENKIPWVNLLDAREWNSGWSNPIARRYGIEAIPTCILVDQKGDVVSLDARGEKLAEGLAKLLGPLNKNDPVPPE